MYRNRYGELDNQGVPCGPAGPANLNASSAKTGRLSVGP